MENSSSLQPEYWLDNYGDYLYQYAYQRVNNPDIAVDLVQDTFLAAYTGKDKYEGKSTEKTWLTSIIKHKIIDHYRRKKGKLKEIHVGDFFYGEDEDGKNGLWRPEYVPTDPNALVDKNIENNELKNALRRCLDRLPEKHRLVFEMRNIEDADTEKIGEELDMTHSNIWVVLHRARLQLRDCIERYWC